MARGNHKKKWKTAVRTKVTPPRKAGQKPGPLIGAGALFLFERGLDMMGYSNPSLGWAMWGITALLLWWYGYKHEWTDPRLIAFGRRRWVVWAGSAVIGVSCGGIALYMLGHSGPTNAEVLEQLQEMLSGLSGNEIRRLEQDYPLGHVLIAFSGEVKKVLPNSNVLEADWDGLTVGRNSKLIWIRLPHLRDVHRNVGLDGCQLSTNARPGAKVAAMSLGNVAIWVECLRTEPIGICAVLGFKEKTRAPQ
jgi:hypothetical protein